MSATARAKVTVVVSHLVPALGMERSALRLVEALDEVFDVRVVSLAGGTGDTAVWSSVVTASTRQLTGLRRIFSVLRARKLLRRDASDVRVLVGAPAALAALTATRSRGHRDVVWEHSLSAERLRTSRPLRLVWRFLARRYSQVGALVAVSPPVADLMRTAAPDRTVLIPNFVPPTGGAPGPGSRPRAAETGPARLLSVGALSTVKNHRALLDALVQVDPSVSATIVGDGPLREQLEEQARRLGLSGRVTFTGRLHPQAVDELMRTSTLLVHPSRSETFGLVYFEAASARLPVVSTDHPVARWLVPTFVPGLCVPESDLATGISAALDAPPDEDVWLHADEARDASFDAAATTTAWVRLVRSAAGLPR